MKFSNAGNKHKLNTGITAFQITEKSFDSSAVNHDHNHRIVISIFTTEITAFIDIVQKHIHCVIINIQALVIVFGAVIAEEKLVADN